MNFIKYIFLVVRSKSKLSHRWLSALKVVLVNRFSFCNFDTFEWVTFVCDIQVYRRLFFLGGHSCPFHFVIREAIRTFTFEKRKNVTILIASLEIVVRFRKKVFWARKKRKICCRCFTLLLSLLCECWCILKQITVKESEKSSHFD